MNMEVAEEADHPATYNFHGLFTVRVAHRGLHALMRRELGMFLDDVDTIDMTIEEGEILDPDRRLSVGYRFSDSVFIVGASGSKVQLSDGVLRAESGVSPEELLTQWTENLMRQRILERGASLVHASAVSRNGIGYLFPAWAHTGKTNVALSFLADGYEYMADDWCFVSATGGISAYPRWFSLFDYNFDCFPQLIARVGDPRKQRKIKRRLAASRFSSSIGGANKLSRVLRRRLSDRYFVYARIPVSRAFPGGRISLRAPLSKACLLETSHTGSGEVSDISAEDLARKVALCNSYERGRFRIHQLAIAYAGIEDVRDTLLAETELLTSAFERAKCLKVTLPGRLTCQNLDRIRRELEET